MTTMKNRIKKYGRLAVLAGALGLGLAGCSRKNMQYEFDGRMNEEYVRFRPTHFSNFLTVRKEEGTRVQYCDIFTDGNVDEVRIDYNNTGLEILRQSDVSSEIWNSVQNSYEDYLIKILEAKQSKSGNYLRLFGRGRE